MTKHPQVLPLSGTEFDAFIQKEPLVFIDFWAPWCAPCLQFASVYEKIAAENPDIAFVKINIEEEHALAETFYIRSIPHLMVLKQGIVIYSEAGSMPPSTLTELVQQARDADVSKIRAQLDEENPTS